MRNFKGNKTVTGQKSNIYSLHNNIKVNRACSFITYNGWNNIHWMFSTSNKTVIDRVKFFGHTNITKTNSFTRNKWFNRFTIDQGTYRFTANTTMNSFTNTNITRVTRLANLRKNIRFITAHNSCRFTNSFSTNRFTRGTNIVTTMCFT